MMQGFIRDALDSGKIHCYDDMEADKLSVRCSLGGPPRHHNAF